MKLLKLEGGDVACSFGYHRAKEVKKVPGLGVGNEYLCRRHWERRMESRKRINKMQPPDKRLEVIPFDMAVE